MAQSPCFNCGVDTGPTDRFCHACGHSLSDPGYPSSLVIGGRQTQASVIEQGPPEPPTWAKPLGIGVVAVLGGLVLIGLLTGGSTDPMPTAETTTSTASPPQPAIEGDVPPGELRSADGLELGTNVEPAPEPEPVAEPPYLGFESGFTVAFRDGRGVQVLDLDTGERTIIADARLGNGGSNLFTIVGDRVITVDFQNQIRAFPMDGGLPQDLLEGLGVVRAAEPNRFWVLGPDRDLHQAGLVEFGSAEEVTVTFVGPLEGEPEFFRAGDAGLLARNRFGTFVPEDDGVILVGPPAVAAASGRALLWEGCTPTLSRCGWSVRGASTGDLPQPVEPSLVGGAPGPQQPALSPDARWLARGIADPTTGDPLGPTQFVNLADGRVVEPPFPSERLFQVRWSADSEWAFWRQGRLLWALHPESGEARAIDVGIPADDRDLVVVSR